MTIQRKEKLPKFNPPAAKIYLDDLEEIIKILKPEGSGELPDIEFAVKDMVCDTIDDLRQLGGRTLDFKMSVHWPDPRWYD